MIECSYTARVAWMVSPLPSVYGFYCDSMSVMKQSVGLCLICRFGMLGVIEV